jgi:hypothetical protein
MPKQFRFRFNKDFDIEGNSEEEAFEQLRQVCSEQESIALEQAWRDGQFTCLGSTEVEDVTNNDMQRVMDLAKQLGSTALVSCKYRGENFKMIAMKETLPDKGYTALKPVALLITDDHAAHLTDVEGNPPYENREEGVKALDKNKEE